MLLMFIISVLHVSVSIKIVSYFNICTLNCPEVPEQYYCEDHCIAADGMCMYVMYNISLNDYLGYSCSAFAYVLFLPY